MAYLKVRVSPGARQDVLIDWQDDHLRLRVRAAPERGKANEAVCRLLAKCLGLHVDQVAIARGGTSKTKLVHVDGLSDAEIRLRLSRT
jgi:uncharacterized protein YggU (UPF0235/DUF167 family)